MYISPPALPARIQRRRVKGWSAPDDAVFVGRPSKWGNRFTGPAAVLEYESWLVHTSAGRRHMHDAIRELRGKPLMCWCSLDKKCHADILLKVVNR
tara:strand:- start:12714 stop:13001 length:288 start_codon:yes stop_codon:yes gene_type:complete